MANREHHELQLQKEDVRQEIRRELKIKEGYYKLIVILIAFFLYFILVQAA